jgi:hypothetical protein
MGFTGLIVIVFVILIVANLVARASRNRGAGSFEDEYYKPTRGREAPTSARRWKAKNDSWGDNIVRMDEALERIKSQVDEPPPAPSNPDHDFSELPEARRKIEAQKLLNLRRGKTVRVYTQDGARKGEVATVTASKVMLREPGRSEVTGINLDDIWGVS